MEPYLRPIKGLSLDAGASDTEQRLDTLLQQDLLGTIADLAGERLANSPKWTPKRIGALCPCGAL